MALDPTDRALLEALQDDADLSTEQLADRCVISPSTVQRRLRALRANGVISQTVAVLDPSKLERATTILAFVETDRERPQDRKALKRWCTAQKEIQQAYYVTGAIDLVLIVIARDIEAFDALMQTLQEAHPIVRRVTTNVVIQSFKRGLSIPLDT